MRLSNRLEVLGVYLFSQISAKINGRRQKGEEVISLAIGDPDIPTPEPVIERLNLASKDPKNHRYPDTEGLPELRKAISDWYFRRFKVSLDPEREVLPLIGSKEGIGHIAFCLIDTGDIALIPDPAYPVYEKGSLLAGGKVYRLPLKEENSFLPDLESIPKDILQKSKVLWLNYPNNPTGATCELNFFEKAVRFAKKYDLVVCHDAAYTEVYYDDYLPPSFLQVPGAKEVGVEFHSCSKSYNMTGWRIGTVVGNQKLISALFKVKSNLDSGIPQAIQYAAIQALSTPQKYIRERNLIYQKRRDLLVDALRQIGLKVQKPKAGLYLWAKIPPSYTSESFTQSLLDKTGILVTPGSSYGQAGEGYIRISLTIPNQELNKAVYRLKNLPKALN